MLEHHLRQRNLAIMREKAFLFWLARAR